MCMYFRIMLNGQLALRKAINLSVSIHFISFLSNTHNVAREMISIISRVEIVNN